MVALINDEFLANELVRKIRIGFIFKVEYQIKAMVIIVFMRADVNQMSESFVIVVLYSPGYYFVLEHCLQPESFYSLVSVGLKHNILSMDDLHLQTVILFIFKFVLAYQKRIEPFILVVYQALDHILSLIIEFVIEFLVLHLQVMIASV